MTATCTHWLWTDCVHGLDGNNRVWFADLMCNDCNDYWADLQTNGTGTKGMDHLRVKSGKGGTRGTISDFLNCVACITVAGFRRWRGDSLTKEYGGKLKAVPLLGDLFLPLVHRMYAHPTGNRAMDTTNIYLRGQVAKRWESEEGMEYGKRRRYQSCHNEDVCTLFFQAILLRYTGRVKRFETYQAYMSEVRGKTVCAVATQGRLGGLSSLCPA